MEFKEPPPEQSDQKETISSTLWKRKDGVLSPLALEDFGMYLLSGLEHREGKMTCLQMRQEDPLEVRFFGDDTDSDDIFHIQMDFKAKGLRVSALHGEKGKINAFLEEFGFFRFESKS